MGCHPQTVEQYIKMYIQEHGLPVSVHVVHIVEETGRAAAGRDNDILKLGHLVQHIPLQFTKRGLSPLDEQFTDGFVKTFLDVPVQINERYIQFAGKSLSQSCFTGSHVTGQKDTYHSCLPFVYKDKQFYSETTSQSAENFNPLAQLPELLFAGFGSGRAKGISAISIQLSGKFQVRRTSSSISGL